MFCVYAVIDPDSGAFVYIGQTNELRRRKAQHKGDARKHLNNGMGSLFHRWLSDVLFVRRLEPEYRILFSCNDRKTAAVVEKDVIKAHAVRGCKLLNCVNYRPRREIGVKLRHQGYIASKSYSSNSSGFDAATPFSQFLYEVFEGLWKL